MSSSSTTLTNDSLPLANQLSARLLIQQLRHINNHQPAPQPQEAIAAPTRQICSTARHFGQAIGGCPPGTKPNIFCCAHHLGAVLTATANNDPVMSHAVHAAAFYRYIAGQPIRLPVEYKFRHCKPLPQPGNPEELAAVFTRALANCLIQDIYNNIAGAPHYDPEAAHPCA